MDFQLQNQLFQWIFRTDSLGWTGWIPLQGTFQSLLQHHSSKASILWQSAFFIVQLLNPYMTTGKTIALTRWTLCWLYRTSPSLSAKNIINLILVLMIRWYPCVESTLVLLEESVCYGQCVLLAKLCQPLPCFILYSKAKFACYSRCFMTSYICIPVPCNERDIFFGC